MTTAAVRRVRALADGDIAAVLRIENASQTHPWGEGVFRDCLHADYAGWVVVDPDDTVLGFAIAMPGVDEVHVLNVCVAPECRRQGLARQLLERVQRYARDLNCDQILLEVRTGNTAARQLYHRLGFAEIGLRRGYYPAEDGREDAFVLALALGGGGD